MTSTPKRWSSITTSLPSSPAPHSSTRVAPGLKGEPIRTVCSEPFINAFSCNYAQTKAFFIPLRHGTKHFPALLIRHHGPLENFLTGTMTPDTHIVLIQRTDTYAGRTDPITNAHVKRSTFFKPDK